MPLPLHRMPTPGSPVSSFSLPVPEQPTNLQGKPMSPNSIQLTWDPPSDSGPSIESYELYFNDSHFRQNVRITISPPDNQYLLTDLTPDTVYHIKVSARSSRGEGAPTPTIQERTLEFGKSASHASIHPFGFPLQTSSKVKDIGTGSLTSKAEA